MTISPDIHAGVDTDVAAIKDRIRRMVEQSVSPLTTKDLMGTLITRSTKAARVLLGGYRGQGTPSHKLAHRDGRHRRIVAGRELHATKGYYGGKKSSRRGNRTSGARK